MATLPTTPSRRRVLTSMSTTSSPARSPEKKSLHSTGESPSKTRGTPPSSSRPGINGSTPGASPQVRAALAALRAKKSSNNSFNSTSSLASPVARNSTASPSAASSVSSGTTNRQSATNSDTSLNFSLADLAGVRVEEELGEEWGVKSVQSLVQAAAKSGRLNLASRSLTAVPQAAYNTLIPLSSEYHSSIYTPPSSALAPPPDLNTIRRSPSGTAIDEQTAPGTTSKLRRSVGGGGDWGEQVDLKVLNLGTNEISFIDEQIGGFEDLFDLDLHNNHLTALPRSLGTLRFLTVVNLASNALSTFPLQLLSLNQLISLDLSFNNLTELWSASNWKQESAVTSRTETPQGERVTTRWSPSNSPETNRNGLRGAFDDDYPSSPSPASLSTPLVPTSLSPPFPKLRVLKLSGNHFSPQAFNKSPSSVDQSSQLSEDDFVWPSNLVEIALDKCDLISASLPLLPFSRLSELVKLDLSNNRLDDTLFLSPSPSTTAFFPSLKSINLSHNRIVSLGTLENLLIDGGLPRKFNYVGLENRIIENLFVAGEKDRPFASAPRSRILRSRTNTLDEGAMADGEEKEFEERARGKMVDCLEILVRGNEIGEVEQRRRRALFPPRNGSGSGNGSGAGEQETKAELPVEKEIGITPPRTPPPSQRVTDIATPLRTESTLVTPTTKKSIIIKEAWEIAAEKGTLTPGGQRRMRAEVARKEREREAAFLDQLRIAEEKLVEAAQSLSLDEWVVVEEVEGVEAVATPPTASIPPRSTSTPTLTSAETSPDDPTIRLYFQHFDCTRAHLALASKKLSIFPLPTVGSPPTPDSPFYLVIESIDLSRNQLALLPLRNIVAWNWSTGLRKLNFSQNKIAGVDWLLVGSAVVLGGLVELNLSGNQLADTVSSGDGKQSILETVDRLAPALEELDLSYNQLERTDMIRSLLLSSTDGSGRKRGVRKLKLNGNRISNLDGLLVVAEEMSRIGRAVESIGWGCEVLDLSDNEIGRLPYTLGHLPHSLSIPIGGNTFRIPKREVYDIGGDGSRALLSWLKDRA